MMEVFDRERRRMAILENACAVSERRRMNAVWQLSFSLPCGDPKQAFCKPFHYVRWDGGELYRIMPEGLEAGETGTITCQCEHVLATLIDNVLFGYHLVGNLGVYTEDVIRYILDRQLEKHWVLDRCDFLRQFEYGWEQETLLSALFSVAAPLSGPYLWCTDTSNYPWKLSLIKLDPGGPPEMYIRRRHNMTDFRRERDPRQLATRLYPLGYGEGVNQLTIAGVNGGVPYLQSPKAVTDKYGIIERVWTDRRYEDPESLKAAAQAMLERLQEPAASYEVGCQELDGSDFDRAEVGKRVRVVYSELGASVDAFITEVNREYGNVERSSIVVSNRDTSIASSLADMADRQRIEQTYAQGATQIYSQALQANCDRTSGAVMDFFLPQEMRIINKVLAKVRMDSFRAYSKSTQSEMARTVASAASQSWAQTSSGGGGSVSATGGGGGATEDTGPSGINVKYGDHESSVSEGHTHTVRLVTSHQHRVTLPDHTHAVNIPSHTHTFTIPGHGHDVQIPAHGHEITPGIYRYGNPQSFSLSVNGAKKADFSGRTAEIDLTALLVGEDGRIPRGSWLSLEVRPDDLAYISIDLMVQGFVQSRGDQTV